jgi:hypothetical protein
VNRATKKNDRRPNKSRGQNPVLGIRWAGEVERPASDLDRPKVPTGCLRVRESSRPFPTGFSRCVEAGGLRLRAPCPRVTAPCLLGRTARRRVEADGHGGRAARLFRRETASVLEQPSGEVDHPASAFSQPSDDLIHFAFSSMHPASASKQPDFSGGRRPSIESERRPSLQRRTVQVVDRRMHEDGVTDRVFRLPRPRRNGRLSAKKDGRRTALVQ